MIALYGQPQSAVLHRKHPDGAKRRSMKSSDSLKLMNNLASIIRKYPIFAFILLSCTWSWGYWELIVRPLGMTQVHFMQIPFAWGPLLAAIIVCWFFDKNLRRLTRQIYHWRVNAGWYILALFIPFIEDIILLVMGVFGTPVTISDRPPVEYLTRFFTTLLIAGALEEFGWRGFLQPRIQKKYSALSGAIFIGFIWALWHFPVVFFGGATYESQDFIGLLILLPLFSIVMAWLYNSTNGALIIPMIFHASINTPNPLVLSETASSAEQLIFELFAIGFWIFLPAVLIISYGKRRLAKSDPIPAVDEHNSRK